jgi:hypothetical protein
LPFLIVFTLFAPFFIIALFIVPFFVILLLHLITLLVVGILFLRLHHLLRLRGSVALKQIGFAGGEK